MWILVDLVYLLAFAILTPWLIVRSVLTGRYRQGVGAKLFGTTQLSQSSDQSTIWFHGVSVGEINLLVTVVGAFRCRHPDWRVVVSTTTETGMAEAKKRFADLTVLWWPFDFSWAVGRTLDAIKPRLVVLAENELWPNFLRIAERRSVPVFVINGRMSPRSARRYAKVGRLARHFMLSRISRFAMQSEAYAQNLRDLGVSAERISVTGSVKYDGVLDERRNPKTLALAELLGIRTEERVWAAGSTHAPEEEIVLEVFKKLKARFTELRLILVPRSADRFDEVARLIERGGLSFVRKSRIKQAPTDSPAVILIDTIGDLNAAWGLADVGFTGGSLDGKRGGQSMIEPAGYGVPVVFGPHIWNFRDAVQRLLEVQGAIKITDAATLKHALTELLQDEPKRLAMGEAARMLVRAQQGATERTLDVLDEVMGTSPAKSTIAA